MTTSSQIPVSQQGVSLHFVALVFIVILLIAGWLTTTNTGTTSTSVTATTATAVTITSATLVTAIEAGTTSTIAEYVILHYTPPPTTDQLHDSLGNLGDQINEFTKKKWMHIKKHPCKSRAAWGLLAKNKEVLHFEWDSQHGDLEVYTPGPGVHLGSIPVINLDQPVKTPVLGRIASCLCK